MEQIVRIGISYDLNVQSRLDFSLLSEYFRSIGVFVHENVRLHAGFGDFLEPLLSARYPIIWLGERDEEVDSRWESTGRVHYFSMTREALGLGDRNILSLTREEKKDVLKTVLNELNGPVHDNLMDVFLGLDIVRHSLNLQYYPNKPSWAIQEAMEIFEQGYEILASSAEDSELDYYEQYARVWYGMRTDEACKYNRWVLRYDIPLLADMCRQLINDYPDRSNAKVLLGLCYRLENEYLLKAVNAFREALNEEASYPYASSVYYWLGKCYQPYTAHEDRAELYYTRSYEKNGAYKSCYKMASMKEKKKEYEAAVEDYMTLVNRLYPKWSSDTMNPIEMEYMFKALHQIAFISYMFLKNRKRDVIWAGKRAVALWSDKEGMRNYWQGLYGDDFGSYWALSRGRMRINSICRMLSDCYDMLGDDKLSKKYSEMMYQ